MYACTGSLTKSFPAAMLQANKICAPQHPAGKLQKPLRIFTG